MKTILKNIMLFAAGALTLGFTACEEDGQDLNFKIQPGNELYAPADNASVNLDQGLNTSFEWAPSVAEDGGYITYEVLFDKADGDFSAPLAVKNSQMTGSKASLSISAKELNEVAALAGIENAKTGQLKWTVRAGKGLFAQTYTQANVLTVSRINLVDPLPTAVMLKGEAVEDAAGIKLIPAYLDGKAVGSGVYECFTKISEGEFTVVDELDRYYKLDASNMTFAIAENPVTNTVSKAGIYWVALDFNAMTYKMREIEKVELWNKPWFGHDVPDTAEMTYQGQGEWSISDYAWVVSHEDGRKDTRYYFICTYVDGFKERWAYYSDDCRGDQNSNPGKYPNFYNIYRFDHSKLGEWDDSWKTQNDSEGVGKKATFHIYMNNTYAADYKHTRSFK